MPRYLMLAILFLVCLTPSTHAEVSLVEIVTSRTNWDSCLQFRVEGPCLKANQPGIIVSYNLPHLLLDTVKIPGDSDITDLILPGVAGPGFLGGGGALGNTGEWNLQYTEAHIVQYPLQLAIQLGVIPRAIALKSIGEIGS